MMALYASGRRTGSECVVGKVTSSSSPVSPKMHKEGVSAGVGEAAVLLREERKTTSFGTSGRPSLRLALRSQQTTL